MLRSQALCVPVRIHVEPQLVLADTLHTCVVRCTAASAAARWGRVLLFLGAPGCPLCLPALQGHGTLQATQMCLPLVAGDDGGGTMEVAVPLGFSGSLVACAMLFACVVRCRVSRAVRCLQHGLFVPLHACSPVLTTRQDLM